MARRVPAVMANAGTSRLVRTFREEEEATMPNDPLTQGKICGGRDDGRPTEDDIAREREGEQGIAGKAKPQVMNDDKLQNPKPIDPGHTA